MNLIVTQKMIFVMNLDSTKNLVLIKKEKIAMQLLVKQKMMYALNFYQIVLISDKMMMITMKQMII
jgi:murein L,D-transpeptidase YafK